MIWFFYWYCGRWWRPCPCWGKDGVPATARMASLFGSRFIRGATHVFRYLRGASQHEDWCRRACICSEDTEKNVVLHLVVTIGGRPRDGWYDVESFLLLPTKIRAISMGWWYSGEMVVQATTKTTTMEMVCFHSSFLMTLPLCSFLYMHYHCLEYLLMQQIFYPASFYIWGSDEGLYSSANSLLSSSRRCFLLFL